MYVNFHNFTHRLLKPAILIPESTSSVESSVKSASLYKASDHARTLLYICTFSYELTRMYDVQALKTYKIQARALIQLRTYVPSFIYTLNIIFNCS